MATQNDPQKNQTNEPPADDIHGRTHNSQNPELDQAEGQADISAIDQQEGTMNHGETGAENLTGKEGSSSR